MLKVGCSEISGGTLLITDNQSKIQLQRQETMRNSAPCMQLDYGCFYIYEGSRILMAMNCRLK